MLDTPPSMPSTAQNAPSGAAATLQQLSRSLTAAARPAADADRRRTRCWRAPDPAERRRARGGVQWPRGRYAARCQEDFPRHLADTFGIRASTASPSHEVTRPPLCKPAQAKRSTALCGGPTFAGRPAVQRGARPPEQARRQAGRGRQAQPRLRLPSGDAPEVAPNRRRAARARDVQRVHGELLARGAPSAMPAAGAGLSAPGAAAASPAAQARVPAAPHGRLRLPGAFSACAAGCMHARVSGGCCAVLDDAGGPSVASRKGVRCAGAGHGLRLPRP